MIAAITRQLDTALRARRLNVSCAYGSEIATRDVIVGRGRVVVWEPPDADTWDEQVTIQHAPDNGQGVLRDLIGVAIRVDGSSPKAGATEGDHRDHVRSLVHAVMVELAIICRSRRQPIERISRAGWSQPEGVTHDAGARYEARLQIPATVTTRAWEYVDNREGDAIGVGLDMDIAASGMTASEHCGDTPS